MKTKVHIRLGLLAAMALPALNPQLSTALAQGTAFTYQGRLNDSGNLATGNYDLRFAIYDAPAGGDTVAGPRTNAATAISNGLFTVTLDFGGGVFTGAARWLEIGVRTNSSAGDFTTLAPLQPLTATPYALHAASAGVAASAAVANSAAPGAIGTAALAVGAVDSSRIADGAIAASHLSASVLSNTFWRLEGNANTTQGTHFLGSKDERPVEFRANNLTALRLELGRDFGGNLRPNVIAGASDNFIGGFASTIAGGSLNAIGTGLGMSFIGGGLRNTNRAGASIIGGGRENYIEAGAAEAVIGGGYGNGIGSNAWNSLLLGGYQNRLQTDAQYSSLVGGERNGVQANAHHGFLGGGYFNQIQSNSTHSFLGGGFGNAIQVSASGVFLGGGSDNTIETGAGSSFLGAGSYNALTANAFQSFLGGGRLNTNSSAYSFLGGGYQNLVQTNASYSFLGGGEYNTVQTNASSCFLGGGRFNLIQANVYDSFLGGGYANAIGGRYATVPGGLGNYAKGDYSFAAGSGSKANHNGTFVWADSFGTPFPSTKSNQFLIRAGGGVGIGTNDPGGAMLAVAGTVTADSFMGNGSGLTALSGAQINPGTVGSDALGAGSVTTENLADGAVGLSKLHITSPSVSLVLSITNPTPQVSDQFGYSVCPVGEDKILIGAPWENTGANLTGAAYLYALDGTLLTTYTNPTPVDNDYFGEALAAVGSDKVLIGASGDTGGGTAAGAAYLFDLQGNLLRTFTNPPPSTFDLFGLSMAGVGTNKLLIGAPGDTAGGIWTGAAYLFDVQGNLLTTITNPTPALDDWFGWSVASVGADKVLIGAYSDNTGAANAGAAYLFNLSGVLLTTFTNPTPALDDRFGLSVTAVGTDKVLIGAQNADAGALDSGGAYLFDLNGTLLSPVTNPTPTSYGYYGSAVASAGANKLLVGAWQDFVGGVRAGKAYVFSLSSYMPGLAGDGAFAGTITSTALADGAVTTAKLAANAVGTSQIADGTIGVGDLADGAVTSPKLADGAVTTTKIAANAVGTSQIADVSIGPSDLTDGAVTSLKLANGAVTTTKIGPGAVGTSQIADGSITVADFAPTVGVWTKSGTNLSNTAGNVGIGNSNPAQVLHVNGSVQFDKTGDALGRLVLNTVSRNDPGRYGIQFANNALAPFLSDDTQLITYAFMSGWSAQRTNNAAVRAYGKAAASWGTYLELTHNGTNALISTDVGHILLAPAGNVGIGNSNPTNKLMVVNARCDGSSWINSSDRNLKENFVPIDTRQVLEQVAALPITRWNYRQGDGSPHLGPVAQDFKASFGLGADGTSISTVDADGVALAAIQGLNQKLEERAGRLEKELQRRNAENADLKQRLERIERLLGQQSGGAK